MTASTAIDTSVAVALLTASHTQHAAVAAWARGRLLALSGHALLETYSVLTRLPGDARVAPHDAIRLIEENFKPAFHPAESTRDRLHVLLADAGISGGAVYDGMVALAAYDNDAPLATRDAGARSTYEALGVTAQIVG